MKESVIIKTGREKDILADITADKKSQIKGIVIFCHGYKGYKDWGAWNLMAEEFVKQNFMFLKFNFSHNGGTVENPIDFPDLEAFGRNTYSLEVKDLNAVVDWTKNKYDFPISVIGHSRGGGIATLVGGNNYSISNVISWAGVADFKERFLTGEKLDKWKREEIYYIVNGRTKQEMPHYFSFYEDFIANEKSLTIFSAAKNITIPHLIIHGDKDEAVNIEDAYRLFRCNKKAIVKIVKGANHTFGSKHPWDIKTLPNHLQEVVDETVKFIQSSNKL